MLWGEQLQASIKDMGAFQGHGAVITPHNIHLGWPSITEGGYYHAGQVCVSTQRVYVSVSLPGSEPVP